MNKEKQIHFRVTQETKEKLEKVAKSENKKPTKWLEEKIEKSYKKLK